MSCSCACRLGANKKTLYCHSPHELAVACWLHAPEFLPCPGLADMMKDDMKHAESGEFEGLALQRLKSQMEFASELPFR